MNLARKLFWLELNHSLMVRSIMNGVKIENPENPRNLEWCKDILTVGDIDRFNHLARTQGMSVGVSGVSVTNYTDRKAYYKAIAKQINEFLTEDGLQAYNENFESLNLKVVRLDDE